MFTMSALETKGNAEIVLAYFGLVFIYSSASTSTSHSLAQIALEKDCRAVRNTKCSPVTNSRTRLQ